MGGVAWASSGEDDPIGDLVILRIDDAGGVRNRDWESRMIKCIRTRWQGLARILIVGLAMAGFGHAVAADDQNSAPADQHGSHMALSVSELLMSELKAVTQGLDAEVLTELDKEMAAYPMPDDRPGVEWVPPVEEGDWPQAKVRTRDWAYAEAGLGNTLAGALVEGEAGRLDLAYWSFLKAARLDPDLPDHLVNLGFHLNIREQYDDAILVLTHAIALDPLILGAHNNLAYALAETGDFDGAIAAAQYELSITPTPEAMRDKLAGYYEAAGVPEAARSYRDADQNGFVSGYNLVPQSAGARTLVGDLKALMQAEIFPLNGALAEALPYTSHPWSPWWQMNPEELTYFTSRCRGGICTNPGGVSIGHYLTTHVFEHHCAERQPECDPKNLARAPCVAAMCRECTMRAIMSYTMYDWDSRRALIELEDRKVAFARAWIEELRPRGVAIVEAARGTVTPGEARAALAYWHTGLESILDGYRTELAWAIETPRPDFTDHLRTWPGAWDCATGAAEREAAEQDRAAREQREREERYKRWKARQSRGLCGFGICKTWSIGIGIIGLDINPRTLEIEGFDVTLGLKGLRSVGGGLKFAYNLKKKDATISIGFSVPVGFYSSAGVSLAFSSKTGLKGTAKLGGNAGGIGVDPPKGSTTWFHVAN